MKKFHNITEDHIDLMHIIDQDGTTSQRKIAQHTGLSIGKVNYCMKALVNIGFIKIHNFNKSNNKKRLHVSFNPKRNFRENQNNKKFYF